MKRYALFFILLIAFFADVDAKTIVLPPHYVNGKNLLTQEMFSDENTTYVVKRQYDLAGSTISLPASSVLKFKWRGKMSNGTIRGNNSSIIATSKKTRFDNITVSGTWHVPEIFSKWFRFSDDPVLNTKNFRSMCAFTDNEHKGVISVGKGNYQIAVDKKNECCFSLNSNTCLIIDGTVVLAPNDLKDYQIIQIKDKCNVSVSGGGVIIGDVETHTGSEGQWGMGIEVLSSENVQICDLTIKNCWGDCIYIGQTRYVKESHSKNVLVDNVTCDSGRRQGMSIIAGQNILVKNSRFINTGRIKFTKPGAGIDIEPNKPGNTVVDNVVIDNCFFWGNHNDLDLLTYYLDETASVTFRNCQLAGNIKIGKYSYNVVVDSCSFNSINPELTLIKNIAIRNSNMRKRFTREAGKDIIVFDNCTYEQ